MSGPPATSLGPVLWALAEEQIARWSVAAAAHRVDQPCFPALATQSTSPLVAELGQHTFTACFCSHVSADFYGALRCLEASFAVAEEQEPVPVSDAVRSRLRFLELVEIFARQTPRSPFADRIATAAADAAQYVVLI